MVTDSKERKGQRVIVQHQDGVELLKALGYTLVTSKYSATQVSEKLVSLGGTPDEDLAVATRELTEVQRKLFDDVMEAVTTKEEIEVSDSQENGIEEAPKKTKKAKSTDANGRSTGAAVKAPPKEKKEKGEKIKVDRFGCRLGAAPADINKTLTAKPKTAEEVAQESGVDIKKVKAHLWWLTRNNFTVKVEGKGWRVAPSTTGVKQD